MPGTKKVFVKTFGCQMNVYDSERMTEALAQYGYTVADTPESAELIVLNTCHIREKAAEKVYSDLGRIREVKEERRQAGKNTVVAVAGCVAQAEGSEIIARAPVVDLVIGPQSYHRLPELVFRAQSESRRIVEVAFPEEDKFANLPARAATVPGTQIAPASAFLTIQEGCDKFCTFCVVPYTRGMEYSRPVAAIVAEAESLVARGVRELTLLGQNVNAYHGEGPDGATCSLAGLINRLAEIDGLERLRYTTSHPNDMSEDLFAAHRDQEKLMPYLHLPFQSGSDRILAAMNRKHTADDYRRVIERLRKVRPDIALSTDIIVGFPSETQEDFDATLALVEEIGFAQAFSFKYSARPGTPAAKIAEQVPEGVKTERLHRLQERLEAQASRFNEGCVGKIVQVLFERPGRQAGQLVGRSPYLQPVHVEGAPEYLGRVIPVEISAAGMKSLSGVIRAA
ncbi:isopentenyl-adenosine A37 tRNA methylthiolase [Candidatus Filomicrobium marinum]|uniref:tRNA-2-methylthio-N(6)-dimethylallyladenosine synthase n=1 Tax=Candidatus Filomicrobium marinum TaxID=1608628 RepID=A0A0D6JGE0_9HYPH|nr:MULTISPECIES: tRNA (N6-isopentenyl adenosine(37)-C2)-methylthiotransferase MiaB [Filomicrobium]MCV0370049.1 tRNA (N6-isopentenyl adenosine(37)-C2)-methylthiotransferase MiaB [Filomicrobium sp.]CFX27425.1 isopentenyl-adenosine A37 tRNA methylthiolase [Candidatus Filomicrobium marinum]CPR19555.1 isopentenyl-adenosine A37 tRNA methylthiolase [Candidatus Filomicrobium marinum]